MSYKTHLKRAETCEFDGQKVISYLLWAGNYSI